MLKLSIGVDEMYDEETQKFVSSVAATLELEHSLVSLSKWEAKYEKPFLGKEQKTTEETYDYIRMMIVGSEPGPGVVERLSAGQLTDINDYITAEMSATWVNERTQKRGTRETITSELIYYWMISLGIPFECQNWHLNRLLTLIRVCNYKNAPKQKMSHSEMAAQRRTLNEQRRAQFGTKG